ncbi:MAG: hypothetical protein EAZ27_03885 [Cytophagales bacterium]|nr:MAG: hypothetical protein EAZ27_03885 [Cytophagales bacterium]
MILQVITQKKEMFNMPVTLQKNYLGKQIHCLYYIEEEAKSVTMSLNTQKKPSDFFGILTKTKSEEFQQQIDKIRGEWNRNI